LLAISYLVVLFPTPPAPLSPCFFSIKPFDQVQELHQLHTFN
jgi:hypothetical protein